jgi:hypothetical protein
MVCAMNFAVEIPWISLWMISGKFLAFLAGTGEISTDLEGENGSRNPLWDKGSHHSFSSSSPDSRELAIWCLRPLGHLSARKTPGIQKYLRAGRIVGNPSRRGVSKRGMVDFEIFKARSRPRISPIGVYNDVLLSLSTNPANKSGRSFLLCAPSAAHTRGDTAFGSGSARRSTCRFSTSARCVGSCGDPPHGGRRQIRDWPTGLSRTSNEVILIVGPGCLGGATGGGKSPCSKRWSEAADALRRTSRRKDNQGLPQRPRQVPASSSGTGRGSADYADFTGSEICANLRNLRTSFSSRYRAERHRHAPDSLHYASYFDGG